MPVSAAVTVLGPEMTLSVPVREPSAVGLKLTTIWQLAPPATELQLLETTLKSLVAVTDLMDVAKLELLVQVKVTGAAVKPTSCVSGAREGCPPSSVSSKSINSSSFSCAFMPEPLVHSVGKVCAGLLVPASTWYSLYSTRPHWFTGAPPDAMGVSKTNCITGFPLVSSVSQFWVGGLTPLKSCFSVLIAI